MSNVFEQMSGIMELQQTTEFMEDEHVEKALLKLTNILAAPDISPIKVGKHIVEIEALSSLFAIKAKYYQTLGKDQPGQAHKKNMYYTLHEAFHDLAASLKYLAK